MTEIALFVSEPVLERDLSRALRAAGFDASPCDVDRAAECPSRTFVIAVAGASDVAVLERLRSARPDADVIALGTVPDPSLAVRARRAGARTFLQAPFSIEELERVVARPAPSLDWSGSGDFITADPRMLALLSEIERAAATESTIRLHGESGTGKDLVARLVHQQSPRAAGPLSVVSCAGLTETLAESELFGHVAGAFTGASSQRPGLIVAANGGTVVLDEISDLHPAIQPKLLRVLQEREVAPLGSSVPVPVDVRIVATHQRDLRREVEAGRFREDLYFRLDVIEFELPPLRERPGDIPLIGDALVRRFAREHGCERPWISEAGLERLAGHPFTGNVRELENMMRRAVILFPGREVEVDELLSARSLPARHVPVPDTLNLRELERHAVQRALEVRGGNRTRAARDLGISVRTLRNKIRLYELDKVFPPDRAVRAGCVSA